MQIIIFAKKSCFLTEMSSSKDRFVQIFLDPAHLRKYVFAKIVGRQNNMSFSTSQTYVEKFHCKTVIVYLYMTNSACSLKEGA